MFISGEDFKVGPMAQDCLTMTTLTEIYMWMHIWVHKYIYAFCLLFKLKYMMPFGIVLSLLDQ